MTERQSVPPSIAFLAGLLLIAAGWALVASLSAYPAVFTIQLCLLLAAILLSENFALELSPFSSVSMSLPLTMAAVLVGGPGAGGLAAIASCTNYRDFKDRRPLPILVFNMGQIVLSACFGGIFYLWLGGHLMANHAGGFSALAGAVLPRSLLAWTIASGVSSLLNLALVGIGITLMRGVPVREVARSAASILPSQLALALVGFLIAQVLAISPVAFPLFLFPLFLARQIYHRYAKLRDEYLDTVRSLISALEAKDHYTRGHSERVADYACALGETYGLDERGMDTLRQAALLHDIGKLAVSSRILSKPSALSKDEYIVVSAHSVVGAEMVLRIPALRQLAEFVKSHHERIDGSGYPEGIVGEQIPVISRILAIADAYDAMTTDRAYRNALSHRGAIAELQSGAGTQFDCDMVDRFVGAVTQSVSYGNPEQGRLQIASECAQ